MKADVVLISEPNKKLVGKGGWFTDDREDAAIKIYGNTLVVEKSGSANGLTWLKVAGHRIISVYKSPSIPLAEFERAVEKLRDCIAAGGNKVLVGGDLNAKSHVWDSRIEDPRGALLADMLAEWDLVIQNRGTSPTFAAAQGESIIDITFTSMALADRVTEREVSDCVTLSDHQLITYKVQLNETATPVPNGISQEWKWPPKDQGKFEELLRARLDNVQNCNPQGVTDAIIWACNDDEV